jgi:hypothetical protein
MEFPGLKPNSTNPLNGPPYPAMATACPIPKLDLRACLFIGHYRDIGACKYGIRANFVSSVKGLPPHEAGAPEFEPAKPSRASSWHPESGQESHPPLVARFQLRHHLNLSH